MWQWPVCRFSPAWFISVQHPLDTLASHCVLHFHSPSMATWAEMAMQMALWYGSDQMALAGHRTGVGGPCVALTNRALLSSWVSPNYTHRDVFLADSHSIHEWSMQVESCLLMIWILILRSIRCWGRPCWDEVEFPPSATSLFARLLRFTNDQTRSSSV